MIEEKYQLYLKMYIWLNIVKRKGGIKREKLIGVTSNERDKEERWSGNKMKEKLGTWIRQIITHAASKWFMKIERVEIRWNYRIWNCPDERNWLIKRKKNKMKESKYTKEKK